MMPLVEPPKYPVGHFCQVPSPGLKPVAPPRPKGETYREVPELWHAAFGILPLGDMHAWAPWGVMAPESTSEPTSQTENLSKQQEGSINK